MRTLILGLLVHAMAGCALLPGGGSPPAPAAPQEALLALLDTWPTGADSLTLLGFRPATAADSSQAAVLDEALLSAALRAGLPVRPGAGVAGAPGSAPVAGADPWPTGWRAQPDRVAIGHLHAAGPWSYLRLRLADPRTGVLLADGQARVRAADLERLVEARQARRTGTVAAAAPELDLELHVVTRRDEGGFARRVAFADGGLMEEGDRLQLRFRTDQDCDVFAFLYRSDGERQVLFDGSAFSGRWLYGPGENSWNSLGTGDLVYTLYFLAAPRIETDKSVLWEELDRLQANDRVEKFRGQSLIDAKVAEFLGRTVEADSVTVSRGLAELPPAPEERRFIYEDGTTFDSAGHRVRGRWVARAASVEVRFQ